MANKRNTKSALISALVVLALSFSALIGTTLAWFTDSVTSNGNVIQTGTFDVGMYWAEGNTDPASVEWTDASLGAIFNNRYWEPGYAEAKHLKVTNEGTLALKFQLAIIPHGEITKLADVIDVYYATPATQLENRSDVAGLAKIGTLADLIETGIANEVLLEGEEYNATIVLKMQETAGNEYQNLSIGTDFSIQLVATQVTSEKDTWGNDYDAQAFTVVNSAAELISAINSITENISSTTTTIFVKDGTYSFAQLVINDKDVTIVGLGEVNFVQNGNFHLFNIYESNVVFKNINMDGAGAYRNGVYVRDNSNVVLEACTVKNTGSFDIIIDEASEAVANGKSTTSTVTLIDSHVEDVAMCASPVTTVPGATWDNFAHFNFDGESTVKSIEIQSINLKPENCYINGSNIHNEFNFYAYDDATLAEALATINANSKYYNKEVIINLAAGEYSGDHVISQYPTWNGNFGGGSSANNLGNTGGNADHTEIRLVGAKAARSVDPQVVFTGNVSVLGFGYSQGGFNFDYAYTVFENVEFNAESSVEANGKDAIALYLKSAANDISFINCKFTHATHVTLGNSGNDAIGTVNFTDCTFDNGGCLSGYFAELNVTGAEVLAADNGFINVQGAANINVDKSEINAAKYLLRTKNGAPVLTVSNTDIALYNVEGEEETVLVNFRGSGESASFVDCTLPEVVVNSGVDFNSNVYANNKTLMFTDDNGIKYSYDENGDITLENATAFTGENLVIPEGVTILGGKCMHKMTNIKTVTFPSTLKKIEYSVFNGCTSLESVVIPGDVELLARTDGAANTNTFAGCTSLTSVVLEEGITSIPDNCFYNCTALESIVIPSTVTEIGRRALYDCLNLKSIVLLSEDCTFGAESFGSNQTGFFGDLEILVVSEDMKTKVVNSLGTNQKPRITVGVMVALSDKGAYSSINAAIADADNGATITLVAGYNTNDNPLTETILVDKDITLIPNGMYLVSVADATFTVAEGAKLIVETGAFTIRNNTANGACVFVDGGEFEMRGGSFVGIAGSKTGTAAVKTAAGKSSTFSLTGGYTAGNLVSFGVISQGNDTVNVTGGTLVSSYEAIKSTGDTFTLNMSGGQLIGGAQYTYKATVDCKGTATINMTGGKIQSTTGESIAITVYNNSTINISGDSVVSGAFSAVNTGGGSMPQGDNNVINISGNAQISASGAGNRFGIGYAVYACSTNTHITVSDNVKINGTSYGIYAGQAGSSVNISGNVVITVPGSSASGYGVGCGNITITGATITAKEYGVCSLSGGTLIIDNSVSGSTIYIKAKTAAVYAPADANYVLNGDVTLITG